MRNSIYESRSIYKCLREIKLCERLSHIAIKHIMTILITMYSVGYRGKTVDFSRNSPHHRTTIAHFLNQGKWDDKAVEKILKQAVIERIYGEAERTGQPILCIVDDTIASKTKPSSQALHPIQDAGAPVRAPHPVLVGYTNTAFSKQQIKVLSGKQCRNLSSPALSEMGNLTGSVAWRSVRKV